MAALDTFEWMVSPHDQGSSAEIRAVIKSWRDSLLTLRSEDERQRFVEEVLQELRHLTRIKK